MIAADALRCYAWLATMCDW